MNMHNSKTRTAQEARAWLESHGVSVAEWARARGFAQDVVYAVLAGRTRGSRGQAHQVAVALGMKPQPASGASPLDPCCTIAEEVTA